MPLLPKDPANPSDPNQATRLVSEVPTGGFLALLDEPPVLSAARLRDIVAEASARHVPPASTPFPSSEELRAAALRDLAERNADPARCELAEFHVTLRDYVPVGGWPYDGDDDPGTYQRVYEALLGAYRERERVGADGTIFVGDEPTEVLDSVQRRTILDCPICRGALVIKSAGDVIGGKCLAGCSNEHALYKRNGARPMDPMASAAPTSMGPR